MNRKGFTLIELLATIVVLGIIVSLTVVSVNVSLEKARKRTEEAFVNTIRDALKIYVDSDAKKLSFGTESVCNINKTHGKIKLYKTTKNDLKFTDVINSTYKPILESELVNPANKDREHYQCKSDGLLEIYRDEDYVYYYKISGASFECLNDMTGDITNLPSECR